MNARHRHTARSRQRFRDEANSALDEHELKMKRHRILLCLFSCEREGIVRGDEGPVGGVAQVVCHGVKSKLLEYMERKDKKRTVKCGER